MPPEFSHTITEGQCIHTELGDWYAVEVTDTCIWWARTRYGKAAACSAKPPSRREAVMPNIWKLPGLDFC